MKIYFKTPRKCFAGLFVAIAYLLTVSAAQAQNPPILQPILLTINITDPTNVIITGTGNDPVIFDSNGNSLQSAGGSIGAGVDLVGLLGPGPYTSQDLELGGYVPTATLTTGTNDSEGPFNSYESDDLNGNDVNLFNYGAANRSMTFSASDSAFALGTSLTINLGALTLLSPPMGEIETGFDGSTGDPYDTPNDVIGYYEVVDDESLSSTPEPSSWTLALIVTASLAFLRFRMRRA